MRVHSSVTRFEDGRAIMSCRSRQRWSSRAAVRCAPMIIDAPHRGHVSGPGASRRQGGMGCARADAEQDQARGATGAGKIAEVADADETPWQHMLDEAPQKFHCGERHRAPLVVVRIVLPAKRDALAVEGDQPVIADRHTMRVAPEIPQDRRGATKGGFGIDDPVGLEERVDEGVPLRRVAQHAVAPARSICPVVGAAQGFDTLAAKHPTQHLNG